MKFYLVYLPYCGVDGWEAVSEIYLKRKDTFPDFWSKEYEAPKEKHDEILTKLREVRDDFNQRGIKPTQEKNIFPELEDILKST